MNLIELRHALRQLRLGGIATVLETRLRQAQAEAMAPIDLISCLVGDELTRRGEFAPLGQITRITLTYHAPYTRAAIGERLPLCSPGISCHDREQWKALIVTTCKSS